MCGIIACHTTDQALDYIVAGLERLEYRGYDSAGVAVSADDGTIALLKTVGRLTSLRRQVDSYVGPTLNGTGIGHTRWATHGGVSERNAHPHVSCDEMVAVVHNGIIENTEQLRDELEHVGHTFASEVDSEVVAHLVEDELRGGVDLFAAVAHATQRLAGSWAIAVLDRRSNRIVVTAHRCPLVVARSRHGDFAASDVAALLDWVDEVQVLRDGDVVELSDTWRWGGTDGPRRAPEVVAPGWGPEDVRLHGYQDFMAKEIAEQPAVVARIMDRIGDQIVTGRLWRDTGMPFPERVRILACGSSMYAGLVIGGVLERVGAVPTRAVIASEAGADLVEPGTLTLAISQSGETADVLHALEQLDPASLVALTNSTHSTLARRAGAVVNCVAGPEIGVAATKTFVAQVVAGVALALSALAAAGRVDRSVIRRLTDQLRSEADRLAEAEQVARDRTLEIVESLDTATGFLFLARGAGVPYAGEGALKLKEITYRWAQAYPAGELKHGPIALIEDGTPAVVIDDGSARLRTSLAEVRARGARVVDLGGPDSTLPVLAAAQPDDAPWGPLAAVAGLQHLARSLAVSLGRDVDKPRNLAKSVTVQ